MDALTLLQVLQAREVRVTVEGDTLTCEAPHDALTPDLEDEIRRNKPQLLALLTPPSTGEKTAAAPPALDHVQGKRCAHPQTYRRPSGVLVCTGCGAARVPGNPEWHRQQPLYCPDDQHVPYEGTPEGQPQQCRKCPYVWPTADVPRDPAVHDTRCPGNGLVVVSSWGWSCPQCNRRYVVP